MHFSNVLCERNTVALTLLTFSPFLPPSIAPASYSWFLKHSSPSLTLPLHFCGPFLLLIFTWISIWKPKSVPSKGSTDLRGLKEVSTVKPGYLEPPWGGPGKKKARNTQRLTMAISPYRSPWCGYWSSRHVMAGNPSYPGTEGVKEGETVRGPLLLRSRELAWVTSWSSSLLGTAHLLPSHIRKVYLAVSRLGFTK